MKGLIVLTLALALGSRFATAADGPVDFGLANGLRVRLVPMTSDRQLAVVLAVRAGSIEEPAGFPHLAHLTEHLVVFSHAAGTAEGETVSLWFRQGRANAETLPGFVYFDLQVDPADLDRALRIQADRLARPELTDRLLKREVPRTLDELDFLERSKSGGTAKFAFSAFAQGALHGRAEAMVRARSREYTVDDVRRFHGSTFRPDRASLTIVGDLDLARAREAVASAFDPIARPTPAPARPRPRPGTTNVRWDASTRHLVIGWPMPAGGTPEHAALALAVEVLSRRLEADASVARLARLPLVTADVEGLFLVSLQALPGGDLELLKSRVLDLIRRIAGPDAPAPLEVLQARMRLNGLLRSGPPGLIFTPPGTRVLARTNFELQRTARALAWGDLEAVAREVEKVDVQALRAAVGTHLAAGLASVVQVGPTKP